MKKHNANSADPYTKIELFTNFAEIPNISLSGRPLELIQNRSTSSPTTFNLGFRPYRWESKMNALKPIL